MTAWRHRFIRHCIPPHAHLLVSMNFLTALPNRWRSWLAYCTAGKGRELAPEFRVGSRPNMEKQTTCFNYCMPLATKQGHTFQRPFFLEHRHRTFFYFFILNSTSFSVSSEASLAYFHSGISGPAHRQVFSFLGGILQLYISDLPLKGEVTLVIQTTWRRRFFSRSPFQA